MEDVDPKEGSQKAGRETMLKFVEHKKNLEVQDTNLNVHNAFSLLDDNLTTMKHMQRQ